MKWTLLLLVLTVSCKMPWAEDEFETSDLAGTWECTTLTNSDLTEVVFNNAGTLIHWYDTDGEDLFEFFEVTTSSFVSSEGDVTIHLTATEMGFPLEVEEVDMSGPMNESKSQVTLGTTIDYYYDGVLDDTDTYTLFLER